LAAIEPTPIEGFRRCIKREPLGTVLVIAPWNYPYLTAVNTVIPALMAGNSVILKHASQTLLVGERFAEAFRRANLPQGLFQNVLLSHAATAVAIRSGRIQQVNFTGSVPAGKQVQQATLNDFLGLGLELGGKDPAYVRADANLEHAVENLVDGSFFNSGQSCCAVERIYVDQKIYPAFIERFADLTRRYVLGNPLDESTTLGPMVSPAAADFVRGQISEALKQGAKALIDPKAFPSDKPGSAYLAPQVLVDVNHTMSVMRDESFGPVVGIMPVSSDDQAIALMNDSEFGLSASIWTQDLAAAERLGDEILTGTVFMNRCDYLDPALAWTGVKNSGRGVTLSRLGYEHLTRAKSFHLRHEV
jgi:acyl-CoA reductase-like NAD-dependent aldehyde dehydrogenase